MGDKGKAREFWDEKIISEICARTGSGVIGEFDREAIRALKSELEAAEERIEELEDQLRATISEASQHLGMYVRSYKKEPFDTGIMLNVYVSDALERIKQAEQALSGGKK